jgi:hypothetical protein
MRNGSWIALATLALLATPARAQIIIDSTEKGPVIIERDKADAAHGGNGIVVHVGRMEVHTSDDVLNFSDFEKPSVDPYNSNPTEAVGGLSIRVTLPKLRSAAHTEAERIAELTGLLQKLNDAVSRQCEPVVAVFGKPCRLSESNLRAYFQPNFNEGPQNGATANTRFEIALPGAAVQNPN